MELLTIFMGIGLLISIINVFILTKELEIFKKKAVENKSDLTYFKNSYIKYYDKYLKLTRPEVVH